MVSSVVYFLKGCVRYFELFTLFSRSFSLFRRSMLMFIELLLDMFLIICDNHLNNKFEILFICILYILRNNLKNEYQIQGNNPGRHDDPQIEGADDNHKEQHKQKIWRDDL